MADALPDYDANQNSGNGNDNGNGIPDSGSGGGRMSHIARVNVGHDLAYRMPWKTLMKMMTENYCPRSEIKKLETELWNLTVKADKWSGMLEAFTLYSEYDENLSQKYSWKPLSYKEFNGSEGHCRSECPKSKNQNCGNQTGNGETRGRAYALGED
ncbi:hypothetical protein Tco_0211135 [Tanacetum coccineum]